MSSNAADTIPLQTIEYVQSLIELKLRQPFTSIDLTKSIVSAIQNSSSVSSKETQKQQGRPKSIVEYIQCLCQIFPKLMKPIKLRALVSILGFIEMIVDDESSSTSNTLKDNENGQIVEAIQTCLESVTESVSNEQDKWISVMTNIIQYKLYTLIQPSPNGDGDDRDKKRQQPPQMDSVFRKGIDRILASVTNNTQHAFQLRQEAENKYMPVSDNGEQPQISSSTTSSSVQKTKEEEAMETFIDSFQIGTDVQPYFVPYFYRLCSSQVVHHNTIYSELNDRCDFQLAVPAPEIPFQTNNGTEKDNNQSNGHSGQRGYSILQMDEMNDLNLAEEERKEMEAKQIANERKKNVVVNMKMKLTNRISTTSTLNGKPTAMTTNNNASKVNNNSIDTAALMMRRTMKSKTNSGDGAAPQRNLVTGKTRKAGFGRGAAANFVGGRSLTIPSSATSRSAMAAKALLRHRKRSGGTNSAGSIMAGRATTSNDKSLSSSTSGKALRAKTKMKMIDVNEVKGLKKEEEQRERKRVQEESMESRKRKIREKAAARGLVSKKRWGDSIHNNSAVTPIVNNNNDPKGSSDISNQKGITNSIAPTNQPDANIIQQNLLPMANQAPPPQEFIQPNGQMMQQDHTSMNLLNHNLPDFDPHQMGQQFPLAATFPPPPQQQMYLQSNEELPHHPMKHAEHHNQQNWQSLLEKSNKLSDEDRHRVIQFFNNRVNPTPDIPVYKTKLHEEKFIDPATQLTVKETYYIELDYNTFGYKKVRKIKKK